MSFAVTPADVPPVTGAGEDFDSPLRGQLADATNPALAAGMVALNPSLTYPGGTVGSALQAFGLGSGSALVGYTGPGAGSVLRTLQAKLRDTVSVKDYGAVGNLINDDTLAIQSCITQNPGKTIYFPPGFYRITDSLLMSASSTVIRGAGRASTGIRQDTPGLDVLKVFSLVKSSLSSYVNSIEISDITFYTNTSMTTGAGLRMTQTNDSSVHNVGVSNMPEGLTVEGGQLTDYYNIRVFASGSTFNIAGTANSGLIHINEAALDGGLFQTPFSTNFYGVKLAGSKVVESCIQVSACDGVKFSNIYAAGGYTYIVKPYCLRDNAKIAGLEFATGYLDAVNQTTGTQYVVGMPDDGTNSKIYDVTFTGIIFGNTNQGGILSRNPRLQRLALNGCNGVNFNTWALDISGDPAYTTVSVSGGSYQTFGVTAGGGFRFENILSASIGNPTIKNGASVGILLSGTIGAFSGSAVFLDCGADVSQSMGATVGSYAFGAAASNNPDSEHSAIGLRPGNNANDDADVLDWYEEGQLGSHTPTLSFGAASVGMVYAVQSMTYTRVGNRVMGELTITLSAKGSSVGTAFVSGLPYAMASGGPQAPCALRVSGLTGGVGDTFMTACVLPGLQQIRVDKMSAGAGFLVQLTDADFTDSSFVQVAFNYPVAT